MLVAELGSPSTTGLGVGAVAGAEAGVALLPTPSACEAEAYIDPEPVQGVSDGRDVAASSLVVGASRDMRSGHRRDRWSWTETATVVAGAVPAAVLVVASVRLWDGIVPSQQAEAELLD